jgi:DNA polymerase-4
MDGSRTHTQGHTQIHAIFADYTSLIQPLSLGGVSRCHRDLAGAANGVVDRQGIRTRILEETGLTASAGISYNKFLAKLTSGWV